MNEKKKNETKRLSLKQKRLKKNDVGIVVQTYFISLSKKHNTAAGVSQTEL